MATADPNTYGSSWYAATRVASPPRGRLSSPVDVDVCVIGGGLAGLTVAREVARRGWSVVVLEAQRLAWNASGRNTGFVLPGFAAGADTLIARVGLDHAKSLWALSEAGADYVRSAIRETGMPGVELTEGGWLHVSKTDRAGAIESTCDLLAGQFGAAVEVWPAARVREALRSPRYFGALHHPRGFSIHPLNYALGLAAAAEADGARIYEDTQALQIDPVGVRKRIVTKHALVRAAHVVLAGNMHLSELMPQFASTLLPVFSYVITTAPLGAPLREAIRYPGAVSDTDLADNHYRVADGNRLIWSGRSTVWHGRPQRYVDTLLGDIARAYPQLREVKAEYAWTGTLGHTVHRMPQIGEISPGLRLLSGFGSHGLNTTAMGGDIVARAIVEGDLTWQLFKPFEMVWAGGTVGRAAQQFYYWSHHAQETVESWFARQREARHRGADAQLAAPPAAPTEEPAAAIRQLKPAVAEERMSIVPEVQPVGDGFPPPELPFGSRKRKPRRRFKTAAASAPDTAPPGSENDSAKLKAPAPDDSSRGGA